MIATLKQPRVYTPERFDRVGEKFQGYELIDGRPEKKVMSALSSEVNSLCNRVLGNHVFAKKLGHVYDSECMYQCYPSKPNQVRKPDVTFVRADRFPDGQSPTEILTIPPDFMIEVISKNEHAEKIEMKIQEFLEAGTPLIWVVYPLSRSVLVFQPGKSEVRFREPAVLSAHPFVDGFEVSITDLLPAKPS
jgi:Uma2 family endonuclease